MRKYAKYVLRRLLAMIPILLIVSFAIFFLLRMSGSSELATIIGEKQATEELKAQVTEEYGLDQPMLLRYFDWLKGVAVGDFGKDYTSGQDVGELIASRIPVTLGLVGISFAAGYDTCNYPGCYWLALYKNKPVDTGISLSCFSFQVCRHSLYVSLFLY